MHGKPNNSKFFSFQDTLSKTVVENKLAESKDAVFKAPFCASITKHTRRRTKLIVGLLDVLVITGNND